VDADAESAVCPLPEAVEAEGACGASPLERVGAAAWAAELSCGWLLPEFAPASWPVLPLLELVGVTAVGVTVPLVACAVTTVAEPLPLAAAALPAGADVVVTLTLPAGALPVSCDREAAWA